MNARSTRLRVRVAPGATRSEVLGRHGDGWRVRVAAAPERGRANDELVALLARTVGVPRPDVRVLSGAGSRDKVVELRGIDAAEVERRLDPAARGER